MGIPSVLLTLSLTSDIEFTFPPVNLPNPLPINPPSRVNQLIIIRSLFFNDEVVLFTIILISRYHII